MIKIRIIRTKSKVVGFDVKGHAGAGAYGHDLVCAGVSAVTVGGLNAVAHCFQNDLSKFEAEMSQGYTSLKINDLENEQVQTVLETLVIQFKTIEETYSKFIKIMEQEVHSQ